MGAFLFFYDRRKHVETFMDEYTEARATYPEAEISYVGHSNGTYILASALQRYVTLSVKQIFFAGSVVPRAFPWTSFRDNGRINSIRNDVASGDWVVAYFPALFELIHNSRASSG